MRSDAASFSRRSPIYLSFGRVCAHPKRETTKLSPRAEKLKLIGYHSEKKAYKLWKPTQERIETSREVIFDESTALSHSPPVPIADDEEFFVDKIVDERIVDGKVQYLVKWTGYDDEDSTWEPYEHVAETRALDQWESKSIQSHLAEESGIIAAEPQTYAEAIASDESQQWKEAIDKELDALNKNRTWELVDVKQLPLGRKSIGCRWVFKRKLNPDGTIERYKARLVAKGYGVDYDETFAPMAKFNSIRVLLSIGAILDLEVQQMDVKSAFLNGRLDEEIYMDAPEGLDVGADKVCKLIRSLYGLKQSSHMWYQRIDEFLTEKEAFDD